VFRTRRRAGVFAGLTLRHGRGHLFRAGLRRDLVSVSARSLEKFDDAHAALAQRSRSAAGCVSPIWAQTVSDNHRSSPTGARSRPSVPAMVDALLAAIGRRSGAPRHRTGRKIAREDQAEPTQR